MAIWGNHSATQYPDFYTAKINGKSAAVAITDTEWLKTTFIETVQKRGAAIIKARGLSSAASAANAIVDGIYALTHNTQEGNTFSMCLASSGQYGVDKGLIFSFPCIMKDGNISVVEGLSFNDFSKEKFNLTLNELRSERDSVRELGLI
jgi:malate dehydrogenase